METYSNEQIEDIEKYLFEIENNYLNPSIKFKKIREILLHPVSSEKDKEPENQFGEVKTFEIFTENYSKIIQSRGIGSALMKFRDGTNDRIIAVHDVEFNKLLLTPVPSNRIGVEELPTNLFQRMLDWIDDEHCKNKFIDEYNALFSGEVKKPIDGNENN